MQEPDMTPAARVRLLSQPLDRHARKVARAIVSRDPAETEQQHARAAPQIEDSERLQFLQTAHGVVEPLGHLDRRDGSAAVAAEPPRNVEALDARRAGSWLAVRVV